MDKIKVIEESLPERCEICHKSDMFDPINNNCSRCNNNIVRNIILKLPYVKSKNTIDNEIETWRIIVAPIFVILSIITCIIYGIKAEGLILGIIYGLIEGILIGAILGSICISVSPVILVFIIICTFVGFYFIGYTGLIIGIIIGILIGLIAEKIIKRTGLARLLRGISK